MDNARIKIADLPEDQSLHIQSSLIGENSISYGELVELQNKTAEDLWDELGDIPLDGNSDDIDENWYSFKKGTSRFEIWSWFEEAFNLSVAVDLMHLNDGEF